MENILIKAYADGIVDSLIQRYGGDTYASVALGETEYSDPSDPTTTTFTTLAKFWWGVPNEKYGVTFDRMAHVTLSINLATGKVTIGTDFEWVALSPVDIHASADWLVQRAER